MKFNINKPKTVLATLLLATTSLVYATPNNPLEDVDVPWEWLLQQEQQKTVEPCESYPDCYDPPPFAPEPTEPEEEERQ